jgi:hypothetical protein
VRCSIDPQILRKHFDTPHVYNLGIDGSTFLSNCILAQTLLETKGKKTLFIELSSFTFQPSPYLNQFTDFFEMEVLDIANKLLVDFDISQKMLFQSNYVKQQAVASISIKDDLKEILQYPAQNRQQEHLGFQTSKFNFVKSTTSFITPKELFSSQLVSDEQHIKSHLKVIQQLLYVAKAKGAKIVFLAPINYRKAIEKQLVATLLKALPSQHKIIYTDKFLHQMTDARFLKDVVHLNQWGAQKYTELLCPLIKPYF